MLGGIPNSLAAFLGKMFGKVTGTEVKVDVNGLKGEKGDPKNEKGAPLGDPGGHLFAGVGFSTKDARSQLKNRVEEANINRFLEAQQDGKEPIANAKAKSEPETSDKREGEIDRKTEAQESREARDKDVKREDQRDDARVQGRHETKEQQEQHDQKEAREKEKPRDPDERDDEEPKHGHGWVLEENVEEEAPRKRGLATTEEVYNDNARCKGMLEDGSRCLRKPVKGVGYCREHALNWRPDLNQKA